MKVGHFMKYTMTALTNKVLRLMPCN